MEKQSIILIEAASVSNNLDPIHEQLVSVELQIPFIIRSLNRSPRPKLLLDLKFNPWRKIIISYLKTQQLNSLVFKVNITS